MNLDFQRGDKGMLTLRWVLLSLAFVIGAVQSQEPAPRLSADGKNEKSHAAQSDKKPKTEKQGTVKNPLVVKTLEGEKTRERTEQERHERDEKAANERSLVIWTIVLAGATLALVAVAAFQLGMFWKQLGLMREGADDTKELATAAQGSAEAAKTQANALMTSARAYVKMSHIPPGLNIEKSDGSFWITEQIKNFGRTPATITDVVLTFRLLAKDKMLPKVPEYQEKSERQPRQAFLAREEEFFFSTAPEQMSAEDMHNIGIGTHKFYALGYVDYIDHFGGRHRAGYARVYNPELDNRSFYGSAYEEFAKRNNLVFVSQEGYNYDRPRKEGEGKDGSEKTTS